MKTFKIYRYNPDTGDNLRLHVLEVDLDDWTGTKGRRYGRLPVSTFVFPVD